MADPAHCSFQFDVVGKARFATSCDIARSTLSNAGVSYRTAQAPAGTLATRCAVEAARRWRRWRARRYCRLGARRHRPGGRRAVDCGAEGRGLSDDSRSEADQLLGPGGGDDGVRGRGHRPLWPDRRLPGGAVPRASAVHRPLAALSRGHRLGRRLRAGQRLRHRHGDGGYLCGAVVPHQVHGAERLDASPSSRPKRAAALSTPERSARASRREVRLDLQRAPF